MGLLLGIVIGIGIGAIGVYFTLKTKLAQQDYALKQTRKTLEDREKGFEARLQATVKSLQADYQKQLAFKTEELRQSYEANSVVVEPSSYPDAAPSSVAEAPADAPPEPEGLELQPAQSAKRFAATEYEAMSVPIVVPTLRSPNEVNSSDRPSSLPLPMPPSSSSSPTPPSPTVQNGQPAALSQPVNLGKTLMAWGYSGQINLIPVLIGYAYNSDSHLRGLAASALGQIAAAQPIRIESLRAISVLERLSRDVDSSVRRAAVEALGKFSSEKVISPLKLALRDVDPDVVRSASDAIANFKHYRVRRPAMVVKSKPKPLSRR